MVYESWRDLPLGLARGDAPYAASVAENGFALAIANDKGTTVHVFNRELGPEHVRIELEGDRGGACLRRHGDHLVIADDRGRILVVSLSNRVLVRELRI